MNAFDALVHAMTTLATGGLANYDNSFGHFENPAIHYAAVFFMLMSALPYVRFVQMLNGSAKPMLRDPQVRTFFLVVTIVVAVLSYVRWSLTSEIEGSFRSALFNTVSIMTGTGYATEDYSLWGPFAMMIFFLIALSGGCAGSTSCSVKIFRYQVLAATVRAQIHAIHNPSSVVRARYDGRPISEQVMSSVMAFFMLFFLSLAIVTLILSLIGLDFLTSLSGAVATLANVGPGLGDVIGPSGNYATLPVAAKWTCIVAMLVGRLELLSFYVMLAPAFWRR
jgi:trk system potassium uptake protein TrkH